MSKTKIFLSWSGDRSRAVAELLRDWLPKVLQMTKPWMSSIDIEKGSRWADEIGRTLDQHNSGIICVTPENYTASWLLFEAGALSKTIGDAKVCPLLFGMSPSELHGPLTQFQATVVEKADMIQLVRSLNADLEEHALSERVLEDAFEKNWNEFRTEILKITKIKIPGTNSKVARVIKAFARYGLPEPAMGSQAFFKSGFESHGLYTTLTEVAEKRLWVYGRKNRKLFDKDHRDFFKALKRKVRGGFDFRALFLDPSAPDWVIEAAHQDDDLRAQISSCLARAAMTLEDSGLNPGDHLRQYKVQRTMTCIIVDDAVLYSPVSINENGRAKTLTKAPFSILNSTSDFGMELLNTFEEQWAASVPFEKKTGRTRRHS